MANDMGRLGEQSGLAGTAVAEQVGLVFDGGPRLVAVALLPCRNKCGKDANGYILKAVKTVLLKQATSIIYGGEKCTKFLYG